MAGTNKQYKAFISYSHRDSRWARRVQRFLEGYRPPKQIGGGNSGLRLGPVFRDRDELPSSADLGQAAEKAVDASEFLIVICSPHSAASRWVNEEVVTFKRLGRGERILCLIVDGEPNAADLPGREAEECFCPALRHRLAADGSLSAEASEPVAADARRGGDGWKLARLKLAAGLLGVGLDDLRQRELQRRNRRLALVSAASLAGMAAMVLLTIAAYTARNDAELRREQADDLIGFMLGDLRDRLDAVGRLDVLDSVADKAMSYFAALPPKDLDDRALAQRAEALSQLGQVQMSRGELQAAMEPFAEALNATKELSARDPASLDRLFDLGQAHFWVGYVYWEQGELEQAWFHMQAYHDLSQQLYSAAPENDDYVLELGYSFNNLAILSERRGDIARALDYSERMVKLSREVFERQPHNPAYQLALAEAYSWSGSLLRSDFRFAAAHARCLEYLGFASGAVAAAPEDSRWLEHLMLAQRFAGDTALDLGLSPEARSHYRDALDVAAKLLAIEPGNERWQLENAVLLLKLVHLSLVQGEVQQAADLTARLEQEVTTQLVHLSEDPDWLLLQAQAGLAAVQPGRSRKQGGAEALDALQSQLEQLLAGDPTRVATRLTLVECLWLQQLPERALQVLTAAPPERRNPDLERARVVTLLRAGNRAEAEAAASRLLATGYRHPELVQALAQFGIDL